MLFDDACDVFCIYVSGIRCVIAAFDVSLFFCRSCVKGNCRSRVLNSLKLDSVTSLKSRSGVQLVHVVSLFTLLPLIVL